MTSGDPMMVQGDPKQYVSERPPELRVRLGGNQTPDAGHAPGVYGMSRTVMTLSAYMLPSFGLNTYPVYHFGTARREPHSHSGRNGNTAYR